MPGQSPTDFNLNSAAPPLPTIGDVKNAIQSAASAGAAAVTASAAAGGELTTSVKTGWEAFAAELETGLSTIAETAIGAVAGPAAGAIADVAIPDLLPILTSAIGLLFDKIGADIPPNLKAVLDKI